MRYKFRIWNGDAYSYENAQEQLNNMAQRGYEFKHTVNMYLPIAVYKKNQDVQKTRYTIEMANSDDEGFFQLCTDAGWEKGPYVGNDQYIFTTKNPNTAPIFSDRKSEYENALRVAQLGNTGCTIFSMILSVAVLAVVAPIVVQFSENSSFFLVLFGLLAAFALMSFSGYAANYFYMKRIANKPFEDSLQGKPKWIRRMGYSNAALLSMLGLILWGRGIWQNYFVYQSVSATIFVIITPFIGAFFLYLSAIWDRKSFGFMGLLIINFTIILNDTIVEMFQLR